MTDDTLQRMANYIALGQHGDPEAARAGLEQLWAANENADPVTRCGIAHSLADVQDNPRAELEWDLRVLTSALEAPDGDVDSLGMTQGVAGFMPSLQLNFADGYRRLGQIDAAKRNAHQARGSLAFVEATLYFDTVRTPRRRV